LTVIANDTARPGVGGVLTATGVGTTVPHSVANYLPASVEVFFQSENGIIGMEVLPEIGEDPYLTDAGGRPIRACPGACSFDTSFGLIRRRAPRWSASR
jgi:acetate CoA/acetoacetate CoA-transferase beta subunit